MGWENKLSQSKRSIKGRGKKPRKTGQIDNRKYSKINPNISVLINVPENN